jgi:hypothetical protein
MDSLRGLLIYDIRYSYYVILNKEHTKPKYVKIILGEEYIFIVPVWKADRRLWLLWAARFIGHKLYCNGYPKIAQSYPYYRSAKEKENPSRNNVTHVKA